jgi:hypothetical protein
MNAYFAKVRSSAGYLDVDYVEINIYSISHLLITKNDQSVTIVMHNGVQLHIPKDDYRQHVEPELKFISGRPQ